MSRTHSGYNRIPKDAYNTPPWVTKALIPHLRDIDGVWECASGIGLMADALEQEGFTVSRSDIQFFMDSEWLDFLACPVLRQPNIITNPPYKIAQRFIEHALELTRASNGLVAMLLSVDFDSAITRRHLFADNRAWCKKVVLTSRIRWFDGPGNPSENHAWYIWRHTNRGAPTISYNK